MGKRNTFLAETMIEAASLGDLAKVQDMVARAAKDMVGKGYYANLSHPNPQQCFLDGFSAGLNAHRADISAVFLDAITEQKYIKQAIHYAVSSGLLGHVKMLYERDLNINWQEEMVTIARHGRVNTMEWLVQQDPSLLSDLLACAHGARKGMDATMVQWLMQQANPEVRATMRQELLAQEMKSRIKHVDMAELLYDFDVMKALAGDDPQSIEQPILRNYYIRDMQRNELVEVTHGAGAGVARPSKM